MDMVDLFLTDKLLLIACSHVFEIHVYLVKIK